MGTLPRRFLALAALMFWQGGFIFYASVVVPVGQQRLGHFDQGLITRRVTDYMNLAGAAALLVLAWDVVGTNDPSHVRRGLRWGSWLGMAALLAALFWLHPRLDALIDLDLDRLRDRAAFRTGHRWYLWLSTVQWGLAILYALVMLRSWREEDRNGANPASRDVSPPGEPRDR